MNEAASDSIKQIISLIQESAVSRLQIHSQRDAVSLQDSVGNLLVRSHWMSFILLSGLDLRIVFKAHFRTQAAQYFSAMAYNCLPSEVAASRGLDFLKEYCNLTAGHVIRVLEDKGLPMGVSIPILARGFDDLYAHRSPTSVISHWELVCEEHQIGCSVQIDLLNSFTGSLDNIDLAAGTNDDSGDVDFL